MNNALGMKIVFEVCCYPIFDPCFDKFSKKSKNSEKH
jgi:hypothetical protein